MKQTDNNRDESAATQADFAEVLEVVRVLDLVMISLCRYFPLLSMGMLGFDNRGEVRNHARQSCLKMTTR